VELSIPESNSLKDKRQVIKSLLARLQNRLNVSAAEVEQQDRWRHATLGVAVVSNSSEVCHQVLSTAVGIIQSEPRVVLEDYEIEIL